MDIILYGYFISHTVVVFIMGSQTIIPAAWVPTPLRELRYWYADIAQDPLVHPERPANQLSWFRSMVFCEVFFQLPVALLALVAFHHSVMGRGDQKLRRWRLPILAYGIHTATTMVPVLGELYMWPTADPSDISQILSDATWPTVITPLNKLTLYGFYVPFLIFPFLLIWRLLPLFSNAANDRRKDQ
jgi:hypothetical protein